MTYSRNVVAALAASVCLVAIATPAYAQVREYNISGGSLKSALDAYARQSGRQVIYKVDEVRSAQSKGVRGSMSPDDALATLLAGTGFTSRKDASGAIAIVRAQQVRVQGQGSITGQVTDVQEGGRLAGVIIRIEETGQETTTDQNGEFRIGNVRAGTVTITTSYLGSQSHQTKVTVVADSVVSIDLAIGSGNEITVYGFRSARGVALNQERTADNSQTVISSDLLGNFNGTTLSDALRRAPGVAFQQNTRTGDGTNIIVRGLTSDYNQVRMNDVILPETSGLGRSANLSNILADSVSRITISKTLLPSQDSAGTGGLVEIETRSPLDRPKRYVNISAEGTRRGSGYGDDYLFSGTISHKFGPDNRFGLSASVQHRRLSVASSGYQVQGSIGPYLPIGPTGLPMATNDIDPRTLFPFEAGVDDYIVRGVSSQYSFTRTETSTLSVSAEWQVSDATNWKVDYVGSRNRSDAFLANDDLTGLSGAYSSVPIPSLGGQVRVAVVDTTGTGLLSQSYSYSRDAVSLTHTVAFRGRTKTGPWSLSYDATYGRGSSEAPNSGQIGFSSDTINFSNPVLVQPGIVSPVTGLRQSLFGPRVGTGYQFPLLTDAGFALLDPANATRLSNGSKRVGVSGSTSRFSGKASVRYDFASPVLRYVEIGGEYSRSKAKSDPGVADFYSPVTVGGVRPLANTLGLEYFPLGITQGNSSQTVRFLTESSAGGFFDRMATPGNGIVTTSTETLQPTSGKEYTVEQDLSGYAQARVDIGKIQIIGGVRFNSVYVDSAFGNSVTIRSAANVVDTAFRDASRVIVHADGKQTTMLPRVVINWRPQENIVFRGGYFQSVARPQIRLLTTTQSITLDLRPRSGPGANQPSLTIFSGNEDLKPARTHSFDFGGEYYFRDVGVLKANVFYKRIENLLESNVNGIPDLSSIDLPDDPRFDPLPSNIFATISTPINNPKPAHIWGIELAAERQLTFLPGALSGLGVYANYTYTKSSKDQPATWTTSPIYGPTGTITGRQQVQFVYPGVSFDQQPPHSGTIGLTYTKYGFDGSLFYTYQSRRRASIAAFGLNQYNEATDSLDFRGEYRFKLAGTDARFTIEGRDLLRGANDPASQISMGGERSVPLIYLDGQYRGGRTIAAGLSITF